MSDGLTTAFVAREMAGRGYQVTVGPDVPVTGGAADSRNVKPGDLFTAFHGENVDGNDFVDDALANGAVAVICERPPRQFPGTATIVVAPDARKAVGELAQAWRMVVNPKVIGITGTVGKTSAKEAVAAALSGQFRVHKSTGNFNSLEGLPLAMLTMRPGDEVSVLEMAMDAPGEIAALCELARPDIGGVLNIGLTHVSKLGSIEAIAAEKLSLPRWLPPAGTALMNEDDPRVAAAVAELSCRVIAFGEAENATLRRGRIEDRGFAGTSFDVTFEGKTVRVGSPLPGTHTVPAALTAIGAGIALGLSLERAGELVGNSRPETRAQILTATNGATIIDDRYNASPASVTGALRMLAGLPGRRFALLGKMAELGEHEEAEHERAGAVAAESVDVLAAFGELGRLVVEAARSRGHGSTHWFETKDEAAAFVASQLGEGDVVLVKGSRSEALETVLPVLGVRE